MGRTTSKPVQCIIKTYRNTATRFFSSPLNIGTWTHDFVVPRPGHGPHKAEIAGKCLYLMSINIAALYNSLRLRTVAYPILYFHRTEVRTFRMVVCSAEYTILC